MKTIRVLVVGACGKTGTEIIKGIRRENDMILAAAVDINGKGQDIGTVIDGRPTGIIISDNLAAVLRTAKADVMVDFTHPTAVAANIRMAIMSRTPMVVGTTGLTAAEREEINQMALEQSLGVIIAPNFALGAVLLSHFAAQAARFLPAAEIIERHHSAKADSPSGTALQIAERIRLGRQKLSRPETQDSREIVPGVRGGDVSGVRIHSLRLPGSVAHHEVVFGGLGQTLTLRHDSLSRESFVPGVLLAIRNVRRFQGVVYGIEELLEL
ncbi:MAG: 4-hydroxy-tetrahydrodipicolinate reductase [bacterium]